MTCMILKSDLFILSTNVNVMKEAKLQPHHFQAPSADYTAHHFICRFHPVCHFHAAQHLKRHSYFTIKVRQQKQASVSSNEHL